jgi:hypothetical protein
MLNCKPGQNAIVVSGLHNVGRVFNLVEQQTEPITVTSECGRATITFAQTYWKMELNGEVSDVVVPVVSWDTPSDNWVLDRPARWSTKFTITNSDGVVSIITVFTNVPLMPDAHLRPLLDIEGDDEMVVIAGKPPEMVGV